MGDTVSNFVIWFTGISGAGKTTTSRSIHRELGNRHLNVLLLDGDELRSGLNSDLGYSDKGRKEAVRRVGELSKFLLGDHIVLVAMTSPFRTGRDEVRRLIGADRFVEVHMRVSLDEAINRDSKGLYGAARSGLISNISGFDSIYEDPLEPEITIDTNAVKPDTATAIIINFLLLSGLINDDAGSGS